MKELEAKSATQYWVDVMVDEAVKKGEAMGKRGFTPSCKHCKDMYRVAIRGNALKQRRECPHCGTTQKLG